MKKFIAVLLTMFSFLYYVNASNPAFNIATKEDHKSFSFGLKIVPSLSFFSTEAKHYESGKSRLNFGYGLIAEFNFAPNYGLLTGLEINDNRGNIEFINNDEVFYILEGDTSKFYLHSRNFAVKYLNIPIVLKLKTNEIGYIKYFGQFGVDAGFRLRARAEDRGKEMVATKPTTIENINIDDEINLLRLGLNVGLGIEYSLAETTALVVGLNYNNGFTNLLKKQSKNLFVENTVNKSLEQQAYNSYITLTLGILF